MDLFPESKFEILSRWTQACTREVSIYFIIIIDNKNDYPLVVCILRAYSALLPTQDPLDHK